MVQLSQLIRWAAHLSFLTEETGCGTAFGVVHPHRLLFVDIQYIWLHRLVHKAVGRHKRYFSLLIDVIVGSHGNVLRFAGSDALHLVRAREVHRVHACIVRQDRVRLLVDRCNVYTIPTLPAAPAPDALATTVAVAPAALTRTTHHTHRTYRTYRTYRTNCTRRTHSTHRTRRTTASRTRCTHRTHRILVQWVRHVTCMYITLPCAYVSRCCTVTQVTAALGAECFTVRASHPAIADSLIRGISAVFGKPQ